MKRRHAWTAAALLACLPGAHAQQEIRHVVVEGDTLMEIAERYLDNPLLWRDLQRLNPQTRNERALRIGSIVVVPLPQPGPAAIHVNGKASYTRAGQAQPLVPGVQLQEKDSIEVEPGSYVTLRWPDGIVTHLLPGSKLRLAPPPRLGDRTRLLELDGGNAESKVPPGSGEKSFQIRTRLGTAAVRGTGFGVRFADTMVMDVTEGTVQLAGQGFQPLDLPAGSGAVADASGKQPTAVPLLPAPEIQVEPYVTTDGVVQSPPVPGAVRYEFELSPAATPEAILRRQAGETPLFPLQPLQEGSWLVRMRAVDGVGIPGLPGVRTVTAFAFPAPVPSTPRDGETVGQRQPGRFVCSEVPGATIYEIEIHSLDERREPVRLRVQTHCEGALPSLPLGRYRWQAYAVRPMDGGRTLRSQGGPGAVFTVVDRPLTPLPEVQPGTGVQRQLSWAPVEGATYVVQVALDGTFARPLSESTVSMPQITLDVLPGRTLYVRVRTVSGAGISSDFSPARVLRGPPLQGGAAPGHP